MGFDIGFDLGPVSIGYQNDGSDDRAAADRAFQEKWKTKEFDFATEGRRISQSQLAAERSRQNYMWANNLKNTIRQAREAGISATAALGAGGAQPMGIQIPGGTNFSGRVGGIYQREIGKSVRLQADLSSMLQREQIENVKADTEGKKIDSLVKIGTIEPFRQEPPTPLPPVPTHQRYYDRQGGYVDWLDPQFAESLDSVGGWFYQGVRAAKRNIIDFWDDSQYFRNEMMSDKPYWRK